MRGCDMRGCGMRGNGARVCVVSIVWYERV